MRSDTIPEIFKTIYHMKHVSCELVRLEDQQHSINSVKWS